MNSLGSQYVFRSSWGSSLHHRIVRFLSAPYSDIKIAKGTVVEVIFNALDDRQRTWLGFPSCFLPSKPGSDFTFPATTNCKDNQAFKSASTGFSDSQGPKPNAHPVPSCRETSLLAFAPHACL